MCPIRSVKLFKELPSLVFIAQQAVCALFDTVIYVFRIENWLPGFFNNSLLVKLSEGDASKLFHVAGDCLWNFVDVRLRIL